jgi:hypothetical protein
MHLHTGPTSMNTLPVDWHTAPLQRLLRGRQLLRPEQVLLEAPITSLRQAFDTIDRLAQGPRGPTHELISDRLMRRAARSWPLAWRCRMRRSPDCAIRWPPACGRRSRCAWTTPKAAS